MEAKGIIRKIAISDIKEGITYKVGQRMFGDRITIEQISQDVDAKASGVNKYDIYVRETGSDVVRLWKESVGMPVVIEYDISIANEV